MALAIFDLDNTLINGDSDHAWGEFLVSRGMVDADYFKTMNDRFYQDYQNGRLDHGAYLEFALKPLADIAADKLRGLHDDFMTEVISPMLQPKAFALLEKHRRAGDFLLVITSTNRFVVEPICKKLGVDDLIATELETDDNGRYTGRTMGTPSFKEGKITRLREWLDTARLDMGGSSFYSDSINDLPLLLEVDRPIAVDPDEPLKQQALSNGWKIISLRG